MVKSLTDKLQIFYRKLCTDVVEDGVIGEAERYLDTFSTDRNGLAAAMTIMMLAYFKCGRGRENVQALFSLLHLMSHLPYKLMSFMEETVLPESLRSGDPQVVELALKCYDNWEEPHATCHALKGFKTDDSYLREYAEAIWRDQGIEEDQEGKDAGSAQV